MKKLLILFFCLFFTLFCYAGGSKEFTFSWQLLNSLHSCQAALDYMEQSIKVAPDTSKIMAEEMSANNRLEEAKASMEEYIKDGNETIAVVAKGMITGIDILIDANNKSIQQIREISNDDQKGFEDLDYKIAKINSQRKEGWRIISMSASFLLPIITEGAKGENPTGAIPFKISKEERKLLLKQLHKLFGDILKRYDNYYVLKKQGKEGNPEDLTWLAFTVDRIRDMLSAETYEEAKIKEQNEEKGLR